jgi:hypothetical protein
MTKLVAPALALLMMGGCNSMGRSGAGGGTTYADGGQGGGNPDPMYGCMGQNGCYTVYAHSDHTLYKIDLANKDLVTVGPFKAPTVGSGEDVMTDLGVSPVDGTIYVISKTNLYTADPGDGHVTLIGPVTACGSYAVALTFAHDGGLYAGDFKGAFCKIDPTSHSVTPINMIGSGMALSGDLVAVADGTMYGSAYDLKDGSNSGTQVNNVLVKIDPTSGAILQRIGSTGYPKLFGLAYALGQVFGFTHDGSGDVVTINPNTGVGTLYNSFMDPSGGGPISFAGAGVNANVTPTVM